MSASRTGEYSVDHVKVDGLVLTTTKTIIQVQSSDQFLGQMHSTVDSKVSEGF